MKNFYIPYYPLTICRIWSDATSLIHDIGDLCLLPVFLVNLARDLSILLLFSKNWLLVS